MKTYKNILIASNLSDESKKIGDKAAKIAERCGAKLNIVHIIEFNPVIYGGGEFALPIDGDIEDSIQKQAKSALSNEGNRLKIPESNQFLETGVTAENLVKLVEDLHIDLLVLGNHEKHGLAIFLGSTANALLHAMPCDVLAVHI